MGLLLVLLPLFGVLFLNLPFGKITGRIALGVAALCCVTEAAAVLAAPSLLKQPLGVDLHLPAPLVVDQIAMVMFLAIAIVGFCSVLIARFSLEVDENGFRFANLLLLALAGMNGIVLASDLFTLYVFLEVTAVSSFILIALEKDKAAIEGAFKYMVLSAVATALILSGVSLLFAVSGHTSFAGVAQALGDAATNKLALLAVALFLGGLAIKAGLVPFHGWLADAYGSAPAPVSVLLAGIVTKTTGVYTLIRLVDVVFGHTPAVKTVLLVTGTLSIVLGALLALPQKDFKRMLAYSSISQVGYIVLGLAAGSPLGMAGAVLHLFNHAIFKTQLFVNAAAVEQQSGTRDMDRLGGIANRMPVTGTTSVVAMLSTAGIPPFSGFWSKLFIIVAVWKAGETGYAVTAVLASVITLAYFLSMQRRVFFGKLNDACRDIKEANLWALSPALLLAGITVALGLAMPWLFDTFLLPVGSILV